MSVSQHKRSTDAKNGQAGGLTMVGEYELIYAKAVVGEKAKGCKLVGGR